ncbi:PKD domain-containing protein, partial [Candidatus Bathyarchaeota archaeon]|nr:PKD domain-containing protein [Candidatus Bathyarchaeota archaeon]
TVVVDRFPEANFTANITTIYKGNSVQFNFTGTEGDAPATFQWNFTDGTTNATSKNPVHQFNVDGNFSIICTVQDLDGDIDSMQRIEYIQVIDRIPTASFLVNATVVRVNVDIQFNFTGTEGDAPATFQWNFTDGTTNATSRNPIHQYNTLGNFTVILTVIDLDGDSNTSVKIDYINVIQPNLHPVANFTANLTTVGINDHVQFNFTGEEGDSPATFQWNFTDGSLNSSVENPSHQFTSFGNFTVILTVIDDDGDEDSLVLVDFISVIDLKPISNFSVNTSNIYQGEWVQFNFTGFEGDAPCNYQWNFGDGTPQVSEKNPVHFYANHGIFSVLLIVTDDDGDPHSEFKINFMTVIEDIEPIANFSANLTSPVEDQEVGFTFSGISGNAPVNYQWNFGDGSPNSSLQEPTHVYNTSGNYTVVLTVSDDSGDISSIEKVNFITVLPDLFPVPAFVSNYTSKIQPGDSIAFTYTGTMGNGIVSFQWNFGDGTGNQTSQNPVHDFDTVGIFTVILTVSDIDGDEETYIMPGTIIVEVETFMNKVLDFLKDNLLLVIIGIGAVALVSVVGVRRRQSVKQKAAVGASKKEKAISKKNIDALLKQIKHLFVFHRKTSACLLYQPFTEKTTDPQLIAGFISAISSFGGTFDKKAKLKVLEYQSFKIILEETLLASYALLFEGQMDERLKEHFSKFIMIFENKYQDEISGFRGDLTPFNDAGDITKRIFKIDRPLQQACISKKTKAHGKTFNLYCARCKEWKLQAPDTSIEGSETCTTCDSALYFVPRCYKCGHSILKPLEAFNAFKKDPETCEKCGGPMYIQ